MKLVILSGSKLDIGEKKYPSHKQWYWF